jgi:uncharacterized protein involved in exopolysaccharide biosynthesis
MENNKIPIFNEKFELPIFFHILNKSKVLILISIISIITFTTLYLRYTKPIYQSSAIIQINNNNNPNDKVLQIEDIYENSNIDNIIELLKSKEFLKRVFNKLSLKISYFNDGTFLSEEMYTSAPFEIFVNVNNSTIYDTPIFVKFINNEEFTFSIGEKKYDKTFIVDKNYKLEDLSFKINIKNFKALLAKQSGINNSGYHIIINNPNEQFKHLSKQLSINVINYSAQTIEISFKDNNAIKTKEIVNSIAQEFLKYDLEKKQLSANKILEFIDNQTKKVFTDLSQTEREIQKFKKQNNIKEESKGIEYNPFPLFTAKINEFEDEISNIEIELVTLKHIYGEINANKDLNLYSIMSLLSNTKSEIVMNNIITNLQELINTKEQLLNDITENNHKIKIVEKQISNQKNILTDYVKSSIERLSEQKTRYKKRISEYEDKIFDSSSYNEIELARLNRLYSINEEFYNKLISK